MAAGVLGAVGMAWCFHRGGQRHPGPSLSASRWVAQAGPLYTLKAILSGVDSRSVIQRLKAEGWTQVRVRGSHRHFKHPARPGLVTVPHPKKDLPLGTLKSIERQSGVKLVEE
jgi:predicted RNA binding protein YcfA (HicA-like mRNA interferase family)